MRYFIPILFLQLINTHSSYSQGFAAVRNISGFSQYLQSENAWTTSRWVLNLNNRYYRSTRDYRGPLDLRTPKEDEIVINSYTMDISITHLLEHGWSISLSLPISANSRAASREHGGPGTTRHTTNSFGLGDIRFLASKWLFKPKETLKGNLQLALGLKFPSGNASVEDYFYRTDSTRVLAPVIGGLQLGDGGLGLISELNVYFQLNAFLTVYADVYYMSTPGEQNGVSATVGRPANPNQEKAGITVASITDAFALRAGTYLNFTRNLMLTAGIRHEGVPVYDLIGKSGGDRRAGYYLSIEPGLTLRSHKITYYTYVPVVVSRSIKQNVGDKILSELTDTFVSSPGSSSNYQLFFGILVKL